MKKELCNHLANQGNNSPSKPVTREAVKERTHELARLAGRTHPTIAQVDYEQAKREITGETDRNRQNAALDDKKQ